MVPASVTLAEETNREPAKEAAPYRETIPGTEISFEMTPIPGGDFLMGSPESEENRGDDEGPQVRVAIEPFWMGVHEVSWGEYKKFMELCNVFDQFNDAGVRQLTEQNQVDGITAPSKLYDPSFTFETGEDPQQPAVSMTQYAAKQYTKWLSLLTGKFYRLPTEAEWEYACRAGSTTAYFFGDDPEELANYGWHFENSDDYASAKVGLLKPNPWGLFDIHGNAAEWVLDQYQADRYAQLTKQPSPIAWPRKLYPRVVRGGSWNDDAENCRSARRFPSTEDWMAYDPNVPQSPWWLASDEGQTIGFRIVCPATPPPRGEWNRYWDAQVETVLRTIRVRIDQEGKGERGLVDPDLPKAIEKLE